MDARLQQSEASFGDWHAQPGRLRTITQRGRTSRITPCLLFGGNLISTCIAAVGRLIAGPRSTTTPATWRPRVGAAATRRCSLNKSTRAWLPEAAESMRVTRRADLHLFVSERTHDWGTCVAVYSYRNESATISPRWCRYLHRLGRIV